MIYTGAKELQSAFIGGTPIREIRKGNTRIWPTNVLDNLVLSYAAAQTKTSLMAPKDPTVETTYNEGAELGKDWTIIFPWAAGCDVTACGVHAWEDKGKLRVDVLSNRGNTITLRGAIPEPGSYVHIAATKHWYGYNVALRIDGKELTYDGNGGAFRLAESTVGGKRIFKGVRWVVEFRKAFDMRGPITEMRTKKRILARSSAGEITYRTWPGVYAVIAAWGAGGRAYSRSDDGEGAPGDLFVLAPGEEVKVTTGPYQVNGKKVRHGRNASRGTKYSARQGSVKLPWGDTVRDRAYGYGGEYYKKKDNEGKVEWEEGSPGPVGAMVYFVAI